MSRIMQRPIYTGIDVGSFQVKVVVAAPPETHDLPMSIVGTGSAPTRGMRHGYITDIKEVTQSIRDAVSRASQSAKMPIKQARISIGGISLEELRSTGEVTLTTSGGLVTDRDIERALKESEKKAMSRLLNRTIIHTIPLAYRIDGAPIQGRAQGLQGTKLAVDTLLFSTLTQHHDDLIDAVEAAGIDVEGTMVSPLAASFVTLTKAQKTAGVLLANLGAETFSLIVFDDNVPLSLKVLSVGSSDITNAIALAFQLSLTEAEQLKRGAVTGSDIPQKKLTTLTHARLKTLFESIDAHLKTIGRQRLLPAGIVITGGGAALANIADEARATLKLPAQIGMPSSIPRLGSLDPTWTVAFGLCRWGFTEDSAAPIYSFGEILKRTWLSLWESIRSILP